MKTLCFLLLFSVSSFASEKKVYTQKEFDEKLKSELEKQVNRVKKKSIAKLTNEVLDKERDLIAKERELDNKAQQLKMTESNVLKKVNNLEKIQKKVIGCIDRNKETESKRVSQLVSMISNMKPVKAAEVLSVQDTKISIKILEQIDPKRMSRIFNSMDKEVSARLQKQYLNMRR